MTVTADALIEKGKTARAAGRILARASTETKNALLLKAADLLIDRQETIISANKQDYAEAQAHLSEAMLDRLMLNPQRIEGMARDVRNVASLPDPVGEVFDMRTLPNGLIAGRKRVPLGVVGSIYESRPNVTIDISALCLKSGNACILRGGKEAIHTNSILAGIVRDSLSQVDLPADCMQFIDDPDRALASGLLKMKEYIDLFVPRGGPDLIRFVGVCHTYVDRTANLDKAVDIAFNAKVQRPTVCNALDSLLVHSSMAPAYLPRIAREWAKAGVEIHGDGRTMSILGAEPDLNLAPAQEEDWGREFLSLTAAVKVVDSLDEALEHIQTYGSGHSEAIISEDYSAAARFLDEVDAAAVYVNASTRFTDGSALGLGAEVGISTQKFHARGPLGLREMTSYKWIITGNGQVRS